MVPELRRKLRQDDSAVSPVIAVILMVAITVVLAAVVYTWASGLAETGGSGGAPGSCSQGDRNFLQIEDVPRSSARDNADFKLTKQETGDVYTGVEDTGQTAGTTEFLYTWSGTTGTTIQPTEVFQVTEQPNGPSGTEWDDRDRFRFRITDTQGTLVQCPFKWSE